MSGRHRRQRTGVIGAESAMGAAIARHLAAGATGSTEPGAQTADDGDPTTPTGADDVARSSVPEVLCIGPRRVAIPGTSWRIVDLADPALVRKLAGIDSLVLAHLDPNVAAPATALPAGTGSDVLGATTDALLAAAEAAGVRRVVLVSSSMVLGASADNPIPLPDTAPIRARLSEGLVAELVHAENACAAWAERTGGALAVVRHALLVGPGIDTALTRFFESPRLLVIGDAQPLWQFTHVDDLGSAVEFVVTHDVQGPVNAVCVGWWDHDQLLERTGMRSLRLPEQVAIGTADRLHRIGASPSSSAELDYLRYPWVVAGERLREAGWAPQHTTDDVVELLLEQAQGSTAIAGRRLGRPDAASLGAAGAAAAVLGAAAIVRARRRRGL